jgi:hypothetical protein
VHGTRRAGCPGRAPPTLRLLRVFPYFNDYGNINSRSTGGTSMVEQIARFSAALRSPFNSLSVVSPRVLRGRKDKATTRVDLHSPPSPPRSGAALQPQSYGQTGSRP